MHEADHPRAIATANKLNRELKMVIDHQSRAQPLQPLFVDPGCQFHPLQNENGEGGQAAHVATPILVFQKTQTSPVITLFPRAKALTNTGLSRCRMSHLVWRPHLSRVQLPLSLSIVERRLWELREQGCALGARFHCFRVHGNRPLTL